MEQQSQQNIDKAQKRDRWLMRESPIDGILITLFYFNLSNIPLIKHKINTNTITNNLKLQKT